MNPCLSLCLEGEWAVSDSPYYFLKSSSASWQSNFAFICLKVLSGCNSFNPDNGSTCFSEMNNVNFQTFKMSRHPKMQTAPSHYFSSSSFHFSYIRHNFFQITPGNLPKITPCPLFSRTLLNLLFNNHPDHPKLCNLNSWQCC